MKLFVFTVVLLSLNNIRAEDENAQYCVPKDNLILSGAKEPLKCTSSRVGGFAKEGNDLSTQLIDYAWDQIAASYDHLLLSVNFDTYTKDRPGFESLYRSLSDSAWEKAVDVIKYVAQRGGKPDVTTIKTKLSGLKEDEFIEASVSELKSLEEAVKVEKLLSNHAYTIHNKVQSHHNKDLKDLDAGVAHFVEEELIEGQAGTIRKLAGLHNDFKTLLNGEAECTNNKNTQLACFLFDEYLRGKK